MRSTAVHAGIYWVARQSRTGGSYRESAERTLSGVRCSKQGLLQSPAALSDTHRFCESLGQERIPFDDDSESVRFRLSLQKELPSCHSATIVASHTVTTVPASATPAIAPNATLGPDVSTM